MSLNSVPKSRNLFEKNPNKESKSWANISGPTPIFDPTGKGYSVTADTFKEHHFLLWKAEERCCGRDGDCG